MKPELQSKLIEGSPFLPFGQKLFIGEESMSVGVYKLLKHNRTLTPIQFGIECGDGWYWLLDNLISSIYYYCKNNDKPFIQITQIKEKFGGLRFYYDGGDDIIYGMVSLAESMSYKICEICGTTLKIGHTDGWIRTICQDCYEKDEKAKRHKWTEGEFKTP